MGFSVLIKFLYIKPFICNKQTFLYILHSDPILHLLNFFSYTHIQMHSTIVQKSSKHK